MLKDAQLYTPFERYHYGNEGRAESSLMTLC